MRAASRVASTDVRGDPCARYVGDVVPGEIAGQSGIKLVDLPKPDDDWRVLTAEVSIDGSGRVRRISWSPTTGRWFKPGMLVRLATRPDRRPTSDPGTSEGRLWNVTEFWDYGCEVQITAPTNLTTEAPPLREIARDLWRMRREYKQRTTSS
jgi:hypothetical protein